MKSISTAIEKARLKRDILFRYIVTASGLLVLATFATIILHIFYNAAPLLYSVDIQRTSSISHLSSTSNEAQNTNSYTGITHLYSQQLKVEWIDCRLKLSQITDTSVDLIKSFVPNCDLKLIGLLGKKKDQLAYVQNGQTLTVYQIDSPSSIRLAYSNKLPDDVIHADVERYQVFEHRESLILIAHTAQNSIIVTYTLNSVEQPDVLSVDKVNHLLPGKGDAQYTKIVGGTITVINQDGTILQSIELSSDVLYVGYSNSFLDLFVLIANDNGGVDQLSLIKFSMVNVQGVFMFKQLFEIELNGSYRQQSTFISHDPIHNLLMLTLDNGLQWFINSVTGDIENVVGLDLTNISLVDYKREVLTVINSQQVDRYQIINLSAMANANILFSKNHYSGYSEPDYIWQTSVSSDFQSPKYSVIPLIMGSFKASLLALIVAIPLSVGAAIYTAYFASKRVRNSIKPVIEMLEAIPSVMIGFIAAVWLAPFAERNILSILVIIFSLPFVLILTALLKSLIEYGLTIDRYKHLKLIGSSALSIFAVATFYLILMLTTDNTGQDSVFPFLSDLNLSKTSIVVALALGVAISPTIYTLIDDALYEVPDGVKQAAFALGATPIQTLNHVVLVVALPSIIAAIMLGFGRAFGETMIVLMVTGNTPIADWDLLSGLRTLTSNLAIELQEARVDSTVYRILFFTAALLFIFTFVINTCASLLKKRLRTGRTIND